MKYTEFQKVIRPLSTKENNDLEEGLKLNGCTHALIVWNNVLIDGHHRYAICKKHEIPFKTENIDFDSRNEAKIWIIKNQLGRRNISKYDKVVLTLKLKDMIHDLALKQQMRKPKSVSQNSVKQKIDTQKELAKMADTSHDTIMKIEKIENNASEETKQKIRDNEMSINKAYEEIRRNEKTKEMINKKIEIPKNIQISLTHGDFIHLIKTVPDNSIDLILTDPPYPKEYLSLWNDLGKQAERILKPSGFLIAYSGQNHIIDVLNILKKNLNYYWLGTLYHKGSAAQRFETHMFNRGKPILFFQKPPYKKQHGWIDDVIISEEPNKLIHEWGQNVFPLVKIIEAFTKPGETVLDPMFGGGSVIEACIKTKRNCAGFEIDKKYYDIVNNRISEVDRNDRKKDSRTVSP